MERLNRGISPQVEQGEFNGKGRRWHVVKMGEAIRYNEPTVRYPQSRFGSMGVKYGISFWLNFYQPLLGWDGICDKCLISLTPIISRREQKRPGFLRMCSAKTFPASSLVLASWV